EYIGDTRRAYVAELLELRAIRALEEQGAAAEELTLMERLERTRRGQALGVHRHLRIPRLEVLHAAGEHDPPAVDEHEIGEHVLDLLDLMRRHHDRPAAIEIIVEQRVVELLPIEDVEAERRLVEH